MFSEERQNLWENQNHKECNW